MCSRVRIYSSVQKCLQIFDLNLKLSVKINFLPLLTYENLAPLIGSIVLFKVFYCYENESLQSFAKLVTVDLFKSSFNF